MLPFFLDYDAFYNCTGLETVDLGNSVTGFGTHTYDAYSQWYGTFRDCKSLTKIVIPSSVTELSNNTFRGCSRLYDVTLPNTLITIGARVFEGCSIKELTIPNSVTDIGWNAFMGCPISSVKLSSSLTSIGGYAFSSCPLTSIDLPASLKNIYRNAFEGTALTEVTIPSSVVYIQGYAFYNCKSLKKVKIENASVTLEAAFHGCTALTDVDLGNAVVAIKNPENFGDGARGGCFVGCTSLTSISLPNTIKIIGHNTFEGCTLLENVTLPNALTTIESKVFLDCTKLKMLKLPNTLQTIGNYTFAGCSNLKSVVLPTSLNTIGEYSFQNCTSLTNLVIPESVTSLGKEAFSNCTGLESVIFDNSVLAINESSFAWCTNLKNVDLGSKITYIGNFAFNGCTTLESVIIPNSVTSIGYAFTSCTSLKNVVIGSGIMSIGGEYNSIYNRYYGLFSNCTKLTSVGINSTVLTSVGACCFYNCRSLRKIELPASVNSIGENAFNGCTALSNIYMNAVTPPSVNANVFSDYTTPTLHVPAASKTDYTRANVWKQFTNIIGIGEEPIASAEEIASLETLLAEAQALYNNAVEGDEPGNYRPGAKAALKAVITEVEERIVENMLSEDVADCIELLETAIRSFKNKQVKNDIQTNNTLSFAGSLKAATGMEFRLPIEMTNTDSITGVQFDLYLPEDMIVSKDEYGDYMIELSRTTTRRHSVASRVMDDGALRVVISSTQNATFEGNSGTIVTLILFPKSTLEAGDYNVTLRNVILTDPDANRYASADMTSVVTVSNYTMGDVNNDGHIDVADLAGVVRFILENADASLVFNAADMDGNGVIEINDYAALVNVILSQSSESRPMLIRGATAVWNNAISLSDLQLNGNGEGELTVNLLASDVRYTGLQFDLQLPEGLVLMDEGTESVSNRHGAWTSLRADGTYRVLCASMDNSELTEGAVLHLKVKAANGMSGQYVAVAKDVVLSDVSATRHEAASAMALLNIGEESTGINDITVGATTDNHSYDLQGRRSDLQKKGLYIKGGKKVVVK